jgi:hypothetical protein
MAYWLSVCGTAGERPRIDSIGNLEAAGSLHAAKRIRRIKGRHGGQEAPQRQS